MEDCDKNILELGLGCLVAQWWPDGDYDVKYHILFHLSCPIGYLSVYQSYSSTKSQIYENTALVNINE